VNDISFHVDKGLCFGILGPNGAGKTSTIKMIYGFSPITSGDIFVFGLDIKNTPKNQSPHRRLSAGQYSRSGSDGDAEL